MEDKYIIKSFDELNVVVQERFEKKEKIKKIVINEEDNCLNCILFDKNNRWCDISDPKEYQEDYELEATWCNCYERTNE